MTLYQTPTPVRPRAPRRRVPTWLWVVLAVLLAITLAGLIAGLFLAEEPSTTPSTGVSTSLDDAGKLACDDFAAGYRAANTPAERVELARTVNGWAKGSQSGRIAEAGATLARAANGTDGAWRIAADGFAVTCTDAGWAP